MNAMLRLGPIITRARTAPISQQVSFLVEFQDRRRGRAALGLRRILGRAFFVVEQGRGAMDDPDVIVAIDRNARDLPEDPIAGQRLRPERLRLEFRDAGRVRRLPHRRRRLLGKSRPGQTRNDGGKLQRLEQHGHEPSSRQGRLFVPGDRTPEKLVVKKSTTGPACWSF
jgi:hypothetical protein